MKWCIVIASAAYAGTEFVSLFNDLLITAPKKYAQRIGSICIPSWGLVLSGHGPIPCKITSRRGFEGRVSIATRTLADGSEEEVIVKMIAETKTKSDSGRGITHPQRERFALSAMRHSDIVPRTFSVNQPMSGECRAALLVMESVGFDTLASLTRRKADLALTLKIGASIIEILREIHDRGFVYNNLAPHHFVIGDSSRIPDSLRAIDFSKAQPYIGSTGQHLEEESMEESTSCLPSTSGMAKSISVFATGPSRRNDMHALAEMLMVLWSRGKVWSLADLPRNSIVRPKDVRFLKQRWRPDGSVAQELLNFWEYTRNMSFSETPDYDEWIARFGGTTPKCDLRQVDFYHVKRFYDLMDGIIARPVRLTTTCPPRKLSVRGHGAVEYEIHPGELSQNVRSAIRYTPALEGVVVKVAQEWVLEKSVLAVFSDSGITPALLDSTNSVDSACAARMMVMESVGAMDLNDLRVSKPYLSRVLVARLALRGIELLRQFHSRGFVHGDIHLGNFCYSGADPVKTLRLIDFDRSIPFVDPVAKRHIRAPAMVMPEQKQRQSRLDPTLLSVYELGGSTALSRRDDWSRLAEHILNLVSSELDLWRGFHISVSWDDARETKLARSEAESVFNDFYRSTLNMGFTERPPYELWASKFERFVDDCA